MRERLVEHDCAAVLRLVSCGQRVKEAALRVGDKVCLKHHFVKLAVLVEVVSLGVWEMDPPVGKKGFYSANPFVVGEHHGRQPHESSKVPRCRYPICK